MSETRLDQLIRWSVPALRHKELIELARVCNPSQAQHLAQVAKWPNRQVRAVKALATVRRDFPGKIFDDLLLTREERIHAANVASGSSKGGAVMDRLHRSLSVITDPHKKFELMLEHGLIDEAGAYLEELVETATVFFYFDGSERPLCRSAVTEEKRKGSGDLNQVTIIAHLTPELEMRRLQGGGTREELHLDLVGMATALSWPEERVTRLVLKILEKTVARPFTDGTYRQVLGTTVVVRVLVAKDILFSSNLFKQVELWQLRWHLREAKLGESYRWFFPPGYHIHNTSRPFDDTVGSRSALKLIERMIERFIELGWEMDQIRQEFLDWLREHGKNAWPIWVYAIAAAKCFKKDDEERYQALRPYLPQCWEMLERGLKNHMTLSLFLEFGKVGLFRVLQGRPNAQGVLQGNDEEFFRQALIKLLAHGRVAWVYQLFRFARWYLFRGTYCSDREREQAVIETMTSLVPQAFDLARVEQRFGVAAALSQHFDCVTTEPNLIQETLELAIDLRQPIRLEFAEHLTLE